jgi:hypothetical protein
VQVINLQMGKPQPEIAKLPPAIAHLRPDLYGQFTVNCGVYVREIAAISFPQKERQFVQEHGCALRARLGRLIEPGRQDVWWRLDVLPVSRVAEDVKDSLLAYGIPFLNRFATRQAIITEWIQFNELEIKLTLRARVDVAIMLATAGEKQPAVELLKEHLSRPTNNPHHSTYVMELAQKLGLSPLS